ncbi:hypothetical protein [Rubritalea marina]|uniref:hypothetical protein n=1 Tax=Rubritalea marina TaxID=361055 RepID=UPI0003737F52|nr:hypothetical protein [Rubritalea marina]
MKNLILIAASTISLISCTATQANAPTAPQQLQLSPSQVKKVGLKIWQNECAGKVEGLTTWNDGEEFPSLGIGHFIWYPAGYRGPFTESFPAFIAYAKASGSADLPAWLLNTPACPWPNKAAFQRDFHGEHLSGLRRYLAGNIELQSAFIIQKSKAALPKILATAPASKRQRIQQNYQKVASTSNGTYALIDYVNFKGEGINPKERYKGEGWGLLQVLENMRPAEAGQDAARAFADSAKAMLDRRIANSPPARGEQRWRQGWHKRCKTYASPL